MLVTGEGYNVIRVINNHANEMAIWLGGNTGKYAGRESADT